MFIAPSAVEEVQQHTVCLLEKASEKRFWISLSVKKNDELL